MHHATTPTTIRTMQASDAAEAAVLLGALGYPTGAADVATRYALCATQPNSCILVAAQQQQLVGLCQLQTALSLAHAPYAYLVALIVAPQQQGQGIGRLLVDAAILWAQQQGLDLLRLRSADHRLGAHAFYTRLGFTQRKNSLTFELTLS